jgi:hypothetical protein
MPVGSFSNSATDAAANSQPTQSIANLDFVLYHYCIADA